MTFYEAAVEVLRRSKRPLHFKKITEVAIRDALLSHVGKTPETTMGERLELEVRRADESIVIKTRPGVYALREEILEKLNQEAEEREQARLARVARSEGESSEAVDEDEDEDELDSVEVEDQDEDEDEPSTDEVEADQDDFEDGDDDSDDSDETDETESSNEGERRDSGRRRRRRRRRNRGENREDRQEAQNVAPEQESAPSQVDTQTEVSGRFESVGEAAYAVLKAADRTPQSVDAIAQTIFQKKLVKFHTHDRAATVQSAMVTDNQVRQRFGKRPLFASYGPTTWGLTEWGLSEAGVQKERQIQKLAQDLRADACTQLGKALQNVKPEAVEMMVITLLERLDYANLKVSKRTSEGDVYFTADWKRGFSQTRVCVQVVVNGESEVGAKDVSALRDSLGHNSAEEGILVHLGKVHRDAVNESKKSKPKITILDRTALLELLVQEGIGVRSYSVPVAMVDAAFIEALSE